MFGRPLARIGDSGVIEASNTAGQPYVWTKTADEILASIARFALRTVTIHAKRAMLRNHWYGTLAIYR